MVDRVVALTGGPSVRVRCVRHARALFLVACLAVGAAAAQGEGPTVDDPPGAFAPEAWMEAARGAAEVARGIEGAPTPDRPAWRRALTLAQRGAEAAEGTPQEADALRLLAATYEDVRWWSRAWATFESLAEQSELSPEESEARLRAARQLAFARYQGGQVEEALGLFQDILAERPEDVEALRWTGRLLLETNRPEDAAQVWERLLEVAPGDAHARYQLSLARERSAYGRAASDAFRAGQAAYDAGDLEGALAAFESAVDAAPDFEQARRWRARLLLETGRSEAAQEAWSALAEARPEDETAAYFAERAALEARVGRPAALARDEARDALEGGEPAEAVAAWRRATEAAPDWLEAWAGLGRTALEAGETGTAREAFDALLARSEEGEDFHAEAERGLRLTVALAGVDGEAALRYVEGVEHYEAGRVQEARAAFEAAAEAAPDLPAAWGWLGRIAFAEGDYASAAEAYARAAELEPGDDDYAFFAEEARRLADKTNGGDDP